MLTTSAQPTSALKFLLVERFDDDLLGLVAGLKQDGVELLTARSGEEAMAIAEASELSLLFIDLEHPGLDGVDLARRVRATRKNARVPVIFAAATPSTARHCAEGSEESNFDWLCKPLDPRLLRARAGLHLELARRRRDLETAERQIAQMAKQLSEGAELYRTLVENQAEMLCRFRNDGTILFVNRSYAAARGVMPESLVGQNLWNFVAAEDRSLVEAMMDSLTPQNPEVRIENRFMMKDGERWTLWANRALKFNETGRWLEAQSSGMDITDRKRAEEAVRESEQRFRIMADHSPVMIWVTDPTGRCTYLNRRWFEFTGQTPEVAVGFGWLEAVHPEDRPAVETAFRGARETQTPFSLEYRLRRIDGMHRWAIDAAAPRFNPNGEFAGYVGSIIDITERKRAEVLLQSEARRLETVVQERTSELRETNEQLEAFVYSIAHDLRSPLRAMSGYSHLLIEDYASVLDEQGRELLQRIQNSAAFMDRLLLDLLAFGRTARAEIELKPVPVQAAWNLAQALCAAQIEEARPRLETAEPLPSVRAHEGTLAQCLSNLLGNALKFVAPGVQPAIRFWAEDCGSNVRLNLQDNGIGIPAEQHDRVFRVFERLNGANYPGTGIGLAIVRKGIERMGGQIGLESRPGQGTRFSILLPKAE